MTGGRIRQINASGGGVPKLRVAKGLIDSSGLVGDHQDDRKHHGGPDRALCLFSLEVIERLQSEGHPIAPGYAGENLTISGIDWATVTPGTRYRLGEAVEIEVAGYTAPCSKNAEWFIDGDFTRMLQSRHPGDSRVYARVLQGGEIVEGDPVVRLTATGP